MKKLLFLSLFICASTIKGTLQPNKAHALHNHIWFNYLRHAGKTEQAATRFAQTLKDHAPLYTYKGYLHLLQRTGDYTAIANLQPKLESLFKNDPAIQLLFAQALEKNGNTQKAQAKILTLNTRFPEQPAIAQQAIQVYINRKEPKNALLVIDTLVKKNPTHPNRFLFYFLKGHIHLLLGSPQKAHAALKKSTTLQPRFEQAWLLRSLVEEQLGQQSAAKESLGHYGNLTENKEPIEKHLLRLKHNKNNSNTTPARPHKVAGQLSTPAQHMSDAQYAYWQRQWYASLCTVPNMQHIQPNNHPRYANNHSC